MLSNHEKIYEKIKIFFYLFDIGPFNSYILFKSGGDRLGVWRPQVARQCGCVAIDEWPRVGRSGRAREVSVTHSIQGEHVEARAVNKTPVGKANMTLSV